MESSRLGEETNLEMCSAVPSGYEAIAALFQINKSKQTTPGTNPNCLSGTGQALYDSQTIMASA